MARETGYDPLPHLPPSPEDTILTLKRNNLFLEGHTEGEIQLSV
jgi:hypothetical protein